MQFDSILQISFTGHCTFVMTNPTSLCPVVESTPYTLRELLRTYPTQLNTMLITNPPKALFFDVFGTVVEWRSCITTALSQAAHHALSNPRKDLPATTRARASAMTSADWQSIAETWRASYAKFTSTWDPQSRGRFISVDQHHYTALQEILQEQDLGDLFTDEERWGLALCWHRLEPRADSVRGLELLNTRFQTCTLSNGNVALLRDLMRNGGLPFKEILSAEHFGAYKPSPKVYLGAAEKFGLHPDECAMVAAHLSDLKAAKRQGFQTVYVERDQEEAFSAEEVAKVREEGFVDIWVDLGGGFIEAARRFGIL